jgi:hypothetical protein
VDPTGLIFVGIAVAWGAYGLSKALEHHDAGARTRTIEKFSHTMRVLARREPVDRRKTALVKNRKQAASAVAPVEHAPVERPVSHDAAHEMEHSGFFPAQTFVRRSSSSRAARRRRRVLGSLLVVLAMVSAVAAGAVISWWWVALPVALLVGWLVACRRMVRSERAARRRPVHRPAEPVDHHDADVEDAALLHDDTAEVPAVQVEVAEPIASGDGWELVPVTLPTYVSKPAAPRRTVNAIDLDSTGVWTSGRTAADSALAQQADAVRSAGKGGVNAETVQPQRRASGA